MRGSVNRFEGTRTIICYMFMLFYTINVVDELRDALIVVSSILISVFFCCMIGITQLFGYDILLSDIGRLILTGMGDMQLNANFSKGQVYQTVANMNYVGMYLSLLVPTVVYVIYYLCLKKNNRSLYEHGIYDRNRKIIIGLFTLFLVIIALNVAGAGSLGGVLGIAVALVMLILTIVENKKLKVVIGAIAAVAFVGMITYVYVTGVDDHDNTGHKQIEFIETGIDLVSMSIDGDVINIKNKRDTNELILEDDKGNPINVFWFAEEEGILQIDESSLTGKIRLIPFLDINGQACVSVDVMDNEWETFGFTFYEDGTKYLNPFGREVSLSKVESFGFDGHLSAGSGRGYIWSRTLPLLKRRLLAGYGADTFIVVFPQNDYAGKYTSGAKLSVVYDKPHNMYLNMALGTGVLSLVAFLAMVGMILWKAFHLGEDKKYIKVIAAGIVGFLIAGLFNDSTVCIMPMFYGLLGTVAALGIGQEKQYVY